MLSSRIAAVLACAILAMSDPCVATARAGGAEHSAQA